MDSKKDKIYQYLSSGDFYTVNQLSEKTGLSVDRVRECISRIKNHKTHENPLNLAQIKDDKGSKRWGLLKQDIKIAK